MPQPLGIDVEKTQWKIPSEFLLSIQGIIAINMIHIAPWDSIKSLFKEAGKYLNKGKF